MRHEKLCTMANNIAAFFAHEADPAARAAAVAGHLARFWAPRMRRELLAWVDASGGEGLSPVALEAVRTHRATLVPPSDGEGT